MATVTETWKLTTNHRKIIRYTNGSYSASYASCSFAKTVGGVTTASPSDGKVEYSFDGMAYMEGSQVNASEIQSHGGQVEFRLIVRGSTVLTSTVSVVSGGGGSIPVTYSGGKAEIVVSPNIALGSKNILLTLLNTSTGATEAAKTISLVPAGVPGASSATLDISPSALFVPADSNGVCRGSFEKECVVRMFVNNKWATITDINLVKQGMSGAGIETHGLGGESEYKFKVKVNNGAAESSYSGFLKITVTGKVGDNTFKAYGTLSVEGNRKGDNGGSSQGSTGPMCYITGEYSNALIYMQERDSNGNVTSTPAVEIPVEGSNASEIWYLDALTNVVNDIHIGPKDSNQSVWKQGLSGYNLIRTKYLFAPFANLGSFVVSGDWLLSQAGEYWQDASTHNTVNGGEDRYRAFKSADPLGTGSAGYPCFAPNFAVDGMTGKVYMKNGFFSGNVYKPFTKITSANYTSYGEIVDGNLRISLENTRYSIQIENIPNAYKQRIILPPPTTYDLGCEISVLNVSGSTIQFLSDSHIYSNGTSSIGALLLEDNELVTLKAVNIGGMNAYIVIGGGSIERVGGHLPEHLRQ